MYLLLCIVGLAIWRTKSMRARRKLRSSSHFQNVTETPQNAHGVDVQCLYTPEIVHGSIYSSMAPSPHDNEFTLVGDTGCLHGMTPFEQDLIHVYATGQLGTISTAEGQAMMMTKFGHAEYFGVNTEGKWVPFYPLVFVVEGATQRLVSPQSFSQQLGLDQHNDSFGGSSRYFWMEIGGGNRLLTYVSSSNIPYFQVRRRIPSDPPRTFVSPLIKLVKQEDPCDCHLTGSRCSCQRELLEPFKASPSTVLKSFITVLDEANQHLSAGQKSILLWYQRLGHVGFQHIKKLIQTCDPKHGVLPFNTDDCPPCLPLPSGLHKDAVILAQSPVCLACEVANAHRRGPATIKTSKIQTKELSLKTNNLSPGDCVSIDHYDCPERGRLLRTYGKEAYQDKYCGGLILADHASGYLQAHHQVSLGSSDTIQSKRLFEQHCFDAGIQAH
jgi:hypothetical protein